MKANITSLNNLRYVKVMLDIRETKITSLGNLQHIGYFLYDSSGDQIIMLEERFPKTRK